MTLRAKYCYNIDMKRLFFMFMICIAYASCTDIEEISIEEHEAMSAGNVLRELLARTVSKPWQGEEFSPGSLGGTWQSSMIRDPKSFNHLIAERDAETNDIVRMLNDYLMEYDVVRREWKANIA